MDGMTIAIFLLILGIVLLVAEAFVPDFGIMGIGGIASIVVAILLYSQSLPQTLVLLAVFAALLVVGFVVLTRVLKVNKIVLRNKEEPELGYRAVEPHPDLIGKRGKAETDLHPSGAAMVEGRRLDVVTQGEYIQKGQNIEIMDVQGMRILVKPEEN